MTNSHRMDSTVVSSALLWLSKVDCLIGEEHPLSTLDSLPPQLRRPITSAGHKNLALAIPSHGPCIPMGWEI